MNRHLLHLLQPRAYWLFAFLIVLLPATAYASPVSLLAICANDICQDLSEMVTTDGDLSAIDTTVTIGGIGIVDLDGNFDADPFISFGVTTTNLSASVTYAFLFGTPITPGSYNTATATGSLSLTSAVGGDATVATGAVYPAFISGYGVLALVPTNLGVDLGTLSCTSSGGATTTCAQGSTSSTFAPASFDGMEAMLTYRQTQLGSIASWTGRVELDDVTEVPEPAAIGLLALGIAGALARPYRKRA
jgi:hypothetical protein